MASPSRQQHHHLLTQSYYDDLLSDNAELYDLGDCETSPSQRTRCVVETLEELSSGTDRQGGQGRRTLDHLILHHPSSARGEAMRARLAKLEAALGALDGRIRRDGTVQPLGADEEADDVAGKLQLVENECSGLWTTDETDGRHAYRSLVAFQTTGSVYTLMSLLGVVALPSSTSAASSSSESGKDGDGDGNGKNKEVSRPGGRQERVLRQVCRTLASILSPPPPSLVRSIQSGANANANANANNNGSGSGNAAVDNANTVSGKDANVDVDASSSEEEADRAIAAVLSPPSQLLQLIKSTKSDIRDTFVAFDRLVGLIELYTAMLLATPHGEGACDTCSSGTFDALGDLARLAAAACGGCERNKVAFVRAGKQQQQQQQQQDQSAAGRDGSGGIAAVVAALAALADQAKTVDNGKDSPAQPAMAAYCKLLAVLCRFDDFRTPSAPSNGAGGGGALPAPDMTVSSAHDHALEFHRQGVVPVLQEVTTLALKETEWGEGGNDTDLASAALAATRTLAVNDEIVQALVAVGVLRSARVALAAGVAEPDGAEDKTKAKAKAKAKQRRALTSASLGLIRNLCGNDEIKTNLCLGTADGNAETSTVLPSVIQAMRLYRTDAAVQEHGCATLAAMALRKPANAQRIVEEGGPMEVLTAMRRHPSVVPVQRQGALAVRNISSRLIKIAEAEQNDGNSTGNGGNDATSPKSSAADTTTPVEVRETFLDLGAETVLRDIAGKHQGSVDEAYAALRDLGCKVSMVRYDTNDDGQAKSGSGTRGVTMFGEAKTKFNPVFEESNELGAAVDRL